MNTIQSLVESANPWKSLQGDAAKLANKWAKTGLLEGLGEVNRNNMALMLENQAKQLVVENSHTGAGTSMNGNNGEQWAGVALPLVRKVFGQIAAKEFVSVQPMNLPSGLVFFLDFQYGNTKAPFSSQGSLYGNQSGFSTTATGGLYGGGRFSYSTNTTSSTFTAVVSAQASSASLAYDSDLLAIQSTLKTASVQLPADVDFDAARSFVPYSASVAITYYPNVTTIDKATNTVTFVTTAAHVTAVSYSMATNAGARGDFEDGATAPAGNTNPISIPEINVSMQSQAITAKTKKLKAAWTPEFAQDLNAYQNLDAEAELTNIMSEYISLEIDLEIMDMLIENATTTDYWSAVNNTTITAGSAAAATLGFYNSQGQWFQTLGTKIQKMSNKIHQLTLRGGANFLVVSPTVATIIESIPGFASGFSGDAADMEYAFGVQKAGQFNSRYTVYKNPYMTENTILVGFRGKQFLEAGAVFAPYIPLIMTPLVYDPTTFTPKKGLLTRFAKKMLRPEFYGKIYVNGLSTL